MKKMNEEKRVVMRLLEDFNFGHFDVKKKLNKIKGNHSSKYLTTVASQKLIPISTSMSSEEGLDRLRKKVNNTH